MTTLGFI